MQKLLPSIALAGMAMTLVACSGNQTVSTLPSTGTLAGVVCPPAGTVAVRDDGSRVRYAGADPSDPAVCLVRTAQGTSRAVGGLLTTHPVNDAARREALKSLFPLAEGRSSMARYRLVSAANPLYQVPFEESFRVTGETQFQTESEARPAWLVNGILKSMLDGSFVMNSTYTIDKGTGVVLAQSATSSTGAFTGARPWRVTELTLPSRRQ